jgi:hypothetical protein
MKLCDMPLKDAHIFPSVPKQPIWKERTAVAEPARLLASLRSTSCT